VRHRRRRRPPCGGVGVGCWPNPFVALRVRRRSRSRGGGPRPSAGFDVGSRGLTCRLLRNGERRTPRPRVTASESSGPTQFLRRTDHPVELDRAVESSRRRPPSSPACRPAEPSTATSRSRLAPRGSRPRLEVPSFRSSASFLHVAHAAVGVVGGGAHLAADRGEVLWRSHPLACVAQASSGQVLRTCSSPHMSGVAARARSGACRPTAWMASTAVPSGPFSVMCST